MSRRKRILIALASAVGLAILLPCIHHWRLRAAAEAYVARIKASGEPMDLAKIVPPTVPPEQNSAPLFLDICSRLSSETIAVSNCPPTMRMVAPGLAMVGWQQPDIRDLSWATNTWDELATELADASDDLARLRGLIGRPVLDFNLDYRQGFNLHLSHLVKLKPAARWLSSAAVYDLRQGKPADACTNVLTMLAMIEGMTQERLLISQLVRIAVADMTASVTWEILQDPEVSDADLARLQRAWRSLEFYPPMESALLMERLCFLQSVKQLRQSPDELSQWIWLLNSPPDVTSEPEDRPFWTQAADNISLRWSAMHWRWFWSYSDEVRALKVLQVVIDATRMAETNHSWREVRSFAHTNFVRLGLENEQGEPTEDVQQTAEALRHLFSGINYSDYRALRRAAISSAWRNVVLAAIALKRYQLRHGRLPASLVELTPDLMKAVPTDPMDGRPLRYRPNSAGSFLLYSVGDDGVDDGGDPTPPGNSTATAWRRGRDWVLPQPATPR